MDIKALIYLIFLVLMSAIINNPAIAEEEFRADRAMVGQETSSAYSDAEEEQASFSEYLEDELPAGSEVSDSATSGAATEETGMEKRFNLRQDRRTDIADNLNQGSQDRQEFRQGRRDSMGEGPEARVENRQEKRENRRARGDDRRQDRTDRLNDRF